MTAILRLPWPQLRTVYGVSAMAFLMESWSHQTISRTNLLLQRVEQRIFCASINSITDREVQLKWFHRLQSEMPTLLQTYAALCAHACYYGQTVDHCPLYV
ncbi:hypothetical protein T12_13529 [Trichinella patagoniensis]|uniref:Uncharacterized protein n=1 Tax=Trichinella patagoniensis TaxID=990121 RepID=A0A0V1A6T6_9BILA|nr:hypothetical protein T12_13529 [Trichinella patagoniensis]